MSHQEPQQVEVLVVGAGQAGVAMSEHLSDNGIPHLVLERERIAERWRTMRWDSLVANGPAWHDRFPGLEFQDVDPDGFAVWGFEQLLHHRIPLYETIARNFGYVVEMEDIPALAAQADFTGLISRIIDAHPASKA